MVRVCMACGKRSDVEPFDVRDETHGVCAGFCVQTYRAWAMLNIGARVPLPVFYRQEMAKAAEFKNAEDAREAYEKARPSWHAVYLES